MTPSLAQTVGNGSSIAPSAGQREAYGINEIQENQSETAFATRHFKRGNDTGIGGSFIGTTSPTSESSPAQQSPAPQSAAAMQFRLPKLESAFSTAPSNPALQSFTPALPSLPERSALTNPMMRPKLFDSEFSRSGLESLPSFSRRPSLFDKMQFGKFDSFAE